MPKTPGSRSPSAPRGGPPAAPAQSADLSLRVLVESLRDYAVFLLDPEGIVATWNPGAEFIKGYRPDEIIGRHFSVLHPPDDREAGKPQRALMVAEAEGRWEGEGWRMRKDGGQFWASAVITTLRGASGAVVGFGKVTRDLTDRWLADEALRESEHRFRLIVQSVRDYGIFMLDPEGRIASWNDGAQAIKGYRAEDAKEKKSTMETYWVPGVNHLASFGRWAFAELSEVYQIEADFKTKVRDQFDAMIQSVGET